jgi:predicted exporter
LYAGYLSEAIRLSAAGFAAIVVLLCLVLRSARRVLRVLVPLILAVLCVAAALALAGRQLTILHLIGMLLVVAVGSNYALFFALPDGGARPVTIAALALANVATVIGFGLLAFSGVPVLEALGCTVAPGALLALLFSALASAARTHA